MLVVPHLPGAAVVAGQPVAVGAQQPLSDVAERVGVLGEDDRAAPARGEAVGEDPCQPLHLGLVGGQRVEVGDEAVELVELGKQVHGVSERQLHGAVKLRAGRVGGGRRVVEPVEPGAALEGVEVVVVEQAGRRGPTAEHVAARGAVSTFTGARARSLGPAAEHCRGTTGGCDATILADMFREECRTRKEIARGCDSCEGDRQEPGRA